MGHRAAFLLCAAWQLWSAEALGQTSAKCFEAADAAQVHRDAGRYAAARDELVSCSRPPCPALVQHDCSGWLDQLLQTWPTLVIHADVEGKDLALVRVAIDGKVVRTRLDGEPIPIDPGEHVLHYEATGLAPVEQKVVAVVGERNRAIEVHFLGQHESSSPTQPLDSTRPPRSSRTPFVLGAVFAGVAAAGFLTDAIVGGIALHTYNSMRSTCASTLPGTCSPSDVRTMRTEFLVGDIALGVGVVSAALAAAFVVMGASRRAPTPRAVGLTIGPTGGGAGAFVDGRF